MLSIFVGLPYVIFSQVSVNEFPKDQQLFKRNISNNIAIVRISGEVGIYSGYSALILEIYKDNTLEQQVAYALSFTNTVAPFEFSEQISAGLFQYKFVLKTDTGIVLQEAENVVVGDIYVLNGQSNIIRNEYANDPFPFQNNFIRTYLLETQAWSTDPNPFIFGGIGYHFAASIVANEKVPVLLLNGGEGGKKISHFKRNNEDITNLDTNYGRLLSRYFAAGFLPGDVHGIIWFQGEADAFLSLDNYATAFDNLYQAWEEDYMPDQYYIFQVRYGCAISGYADYRKLFQAPEANRRLGTLPKTKIISTNAVAKGADNCHYYGTDGYTILAKRLYDLVAYDFYNSGNNSGIYSPNIENVRFTNASKNQIMFDILPATDAYTWQIGVENDFWIEGTDAISITDGCVLGNTVTLNLSESSTKAFPKLSYLGHNPNNTPFIVNQNGIGMLSFKNIDIADSLQEADNDFLNDFSMYPNPATTMVTIESGFPCNSTIEIYAVSGQKVFSRKNHQEQLIQIDVSNFSSGQYFIKIIYQSETILKKLLIG